MSIVVNSGYNASLVAADVKNRQSANLIRVRKHRTQLRKISKVVFF